ncbi:MAG: hypothetical protein J6W64_06865 [Bacilli bacterium]|nr:hypothetical protein [Bacilli bacterium]MBO7526288.1 hypothetical protein [Clostridia bacterium]
MAVTDYRISKLREYLFEVINTLTTDRNYQINANMLSNNINDYSLDKIPTASTIEKYITGNALHRDVYSFRSRKSYSQDTIKNLENMGFFEQFENAINNNNNEGILPNINGIQSIECLNPFTMLSNSDGKTAIFDIQIQITYKVSREREVISL